MATLAVHLSTCRCLQIWLAVRSSCSTSASRRSGRRDWWDDEVFLGLARLRGMECRSTYAEAFTCTKSLIQPLSFSAGAPEP